MLQNRLKLIIIIIIIIVIIIIVIIIIIIIINKYKINKTVELKPRRVKAD